MESPHELRKRSGFEVRLTQAGGQTRSIAVQPKNGAPAYEVAPLPAADTATEGQGGSSGRSRWRVLSF